MIDLLKGWYKEMFVRFLGVNIFVLLCLIGMFSTLYLFTPATLIECIIGFFFWLFGLLAMQIWGYWDNKRKND